MSILAAVDGERVPSETVETGRELAQQFEEELVVMHVMPSDTFEDVRDGSAKRSESNLGNLLTGDVTYGGRDEQTSESGSSSRGPYTEEDGENDARKVARSVTRRTLNEDTGVTYQGRVGDPADEILDEADRRDTRYLVIGGRRRSPIGKAIFGSTTQSILLNSTRPVMTVMQEE